jgi:hypothetical protein
MLIYVLRWWPSWVFDRHKKQKFVEDLPMIIPGQFGFNCPSGFFSETTNMIKAKLYMNVHWMVLYNLKVFYSDMKFKMAATAGLSLTLDPMRKTLVSEKKIFEISANQSILMALAAMLNIRLERKTETL